MHTLHSFSSCIFIRNLSILRPCALERGWVPSWGRGKKDKKKKIMKTLSQTQCYVGHNFYRIQFSITLHCQYPWLFLVEIVLPLLETLFHKVQLSITLYCQALKFPVEIVLQCHNTYTITPCHAVILSQENLILIMHSNKK